MRGTILLVFGTCALVGLSAPGLGWHPAPLPPQDHPAHVPHAPIQFNSNLDLGIRQGPACAPNYANGVVGGCGTEGEPWIISGWLLTGIAFSFDLSGITFFGTTDHVLVRDNQFTLGGAIHLRGAENIRIEENVFVSANALWVDDPFNNAPSKNIVFKSNQVDAAGQAYGIGIRGNTGGPIRTVVITENNFENAFNQAISLRRTSGLTISGNTITGNQDGISCAISCGGVIENNLIADNAGAGIKGRWCNWGGGTVKDNIVRDNAEGITGAVCNSTPEIYGNNISGNDNWGARLNDATMDARHNWWGDTSGPSGDGSGDGDAIIHMGGGSTTFSPWLAAPNPNAGP